MPSCNLGHRHNVMCPPFFSKGFLKTYYKANDSLILRVMLGVRSTREKELEPHPLIS